MQFKTRYPPTNHPQPFLTPKITQVAQKFENPQELTHLLFPTSSHNKHIYTQALTHAMDLGVWLTPTICFDPQENWRLKSHQNLRNLKNPQELTRILLPYIQPRKHTHTHTHIRPRSSYESSNHMRLFLKVQKLSTVSDSCINLMHRFTELNRTCKSTLTDRITNFFPISTYSPAEELNSGCW